MGLHFNQDLEIESSSRRGCHFSTILRALLITQYFRAMTTFVFIKHLVLYLYG